VKQTKQNRRTGEIPLPRLNGRLNSDPGFTGIQPRKYRTAQAYDAPYPRRRRERGVNRKPSDTDVRSREVATLLDPSTAGKAIAAVSETPAAATASVRFEGFRSIGLLPS